MATAFLIELPDELATAFSEYCWLRKLTEEQAITHLIEVRLKQSGHSHANFALVRGLATITPASPIHDLCLSVRARKACSKLDIKTVQDLTQTTSDTLLTCKNFGPTTLIEVIIKLKSIGLELADGCTAEQAMSKGFNHSSKMNRSMV